ncbi:hypothetical protein [Streptomyces violaceusniger]|nr:hypothetical protein [Streptomyces violaceusniger]
MPLRQPHADDDGPQVSFTVQSWRRIVRTLLAEPNLSTLPCRRDLLLVAYDFAALCDVGGRGAYSAKERTGRARDDRPDPSLCELTEMSKVQTGRMLKLLIALGCLRMVRQAAMGRQAVYQATIPTGSPESMGRCLAAAAELGFKPRTRRDMTKQADARRLIKAHEEALQVLAEVPRTAVESPVDNSELGVMQTTPSGGHADDPPRGHADDPQQGHADDPPLPIGALGSKGTICSHLGTGPWVAGTGARKEDHRGGGGEHGQQPVPTSVATIDGDPAGNRWGSAVSQEAIRRTGRDRMRAELAKADRCQGLHGKGCRFTRPVSPSNDKGLCIRCYALIAEPDDRPEDRPEDGSPIPLSFDTPTMPPPTYGTEDGDRRS